MDHPMMYVNKKQENRMEKGRVQEFRIAVLGMTGKGKSSLIQRLTKNVFSETPHTEEEQHSTVVWDNSFVYFWEFPPDVLTPENFDVTVVGFGGFIYVFDLTETATEEFQSTKEYLEELMKNDVIANIPYLLVGTFLDNIEDLTDLKPSKLMSTLTENLPKTQLILCSSQSGQGIAEIQQWIVNRAQVASTNEMKVNQTSSMIFNKTFG